MNYKTSVPQHIIKEAKELRAEMFAHYDGMLDYAPNFHPASITQLAKRYGIPTSTLWKALNYD